MDILVKNGTALNIPVKPVVKTQEFAVGSNTLVRRLLPYLMVAPAIAASLIFLIYPIIYMFRLSFYKWNMIGEMKFIGLDNYIDLFSDPEFMQVLFNTCQFTFWTVAGSIVLGLVLAVYLRKNTRINRFIQGIMFTPYVLPMISIAFVWMWIMDTDLGLLNYVLGLFGIDKVMWLNDPKVAMYSLIIVNIWKAAGYYTLIFLSALQSIPSYLYEAAELDHAKPATTFFKITLPMISPLVLFNAVNGCVSALNGSFALLYPLTGESGDPDAMTQVLSLLIYKEAFSNMKVGYSCALSVVLFLIAAMFGGLLFLISKKLVYYEN